MCFCLLQLNWEFEQCLRGLFEDWTWQMNEFQLQFLPLNFLSFFCFSPHCTTYTQRKVFFFVSTTYFNTFSSRGQFHQQFTCAFLPISLGQKITKPKCNREKLGKALLFEKCVRKMLMKLTPVNVSTFGYCVLPLLSALENSFNNSAKIVYESWTKNKKMVREIWLWIANPGHYLMRNDHSDPEGNV